MGTGLIHALDSYIEFQHEGLPLFRYVYEPGIASEESPKPYFHPLRTLAGNEVTLFRPHDHPWHTGLSMTSAHLSGQNFWGGPTYVRGRGYVGLDNHGRIEHVGWRDVRHGAGLPRIEEDLRWVARDGNVWINEDRQIAVEEIDPEGGYWSLALRFHLRNVGGMPLAFGSPTTEGRPRAGYGGLFWRGPRSFSNGTILAAGGLEGAGVMGEAAPWLAYIGTHDGTGEKSTLLFVDHPSNPRYPNKWFVREEPYACASFAFMFDEEYTLEPGDVLALRYRVVLADGEWSLAGIEKYLSPAPSA